ncbi:antibiotic biosynthesis monooxygenase [Parasphingopyxis algicola]|uniref:putative quinol monooxygenase n=1 Tax=Parasphingopyxis algicola TaxID=2026624 RepID=UPI0015A1444B|nr:putative quinol monooxygenase [Parasphingopyxis algicola]QLC25392.1 antibiotic biosynthesis monooxygenase [Parasphingopyxis algicola]
MKVVVSAMVDLEPEKREEALKTAQPFIDGALSQDGCIAYAWTADLNDPARVQVFEEWESEEALASHLAGPHYLGMLDHMGSFGIVNAVSRKYRVDKEGPVYNAEGVATADFD